MATTQIRRKDASVQQLHASVHLPAPTPWPFLMALGVTLMIGSLVLSGAVGALGALIALGSAVGWFRDLLPDEKHEEIPVTVEIADVPRSERPVARIDIDETHRAQLPLRTFSVMSGIKGGIAGGIAMVIPAEIYGVLRYHSLWYVVNLLGGGGVGAWADPTPAQLTHFNLGAFLTANVIQGATTLLVGLLYGALLPLWPKRPILLGGLVGPILWTGLLHSVLGLLNSFLTERIDWISFAISQVFFGVVAGYVVSRSGNLKQLAQVPLPVRLGVESPGLMRDERGKEPKR